MKKALLLHLIAVMLPAVIMSLYPNIHNLTITDIKLLSNGQVQIAGTLEIDFTKPYIYKGGNFYWFNLWWQSQVGRSFGKVHLVSVEWTLLESTPTYDKLSFTIILEFSEAKF